MKIKKVCSKTSLTPLKGRKIEYIAVHYTAGTTSKAGTATNLAKWFAAGANKDNPVSSDFIVDDADVVQYNEDILNYYAWCVGGKKYPNPTTSLGGTLYGKATNRNTISIEVCSSKKNPKSLNANDTDWYFTDAAIDNTVQLVKYLMKKYNIPIERVIMHHHVTGKMCPAMWTHNEKELDGWYDFVSQLRDKTVEQQKQEAISVKKKMYYVQVGAFGIRANAEKYLQEVKKHYPNAFIKVSD